MEKTICNGKITYATLSMNNGHLQLRLCIEYWEGKGKRSSTCGHNNLGEKIYNSETGEYTYDSWSHAADFIMGVLDTVGAESVINLSGKYVRVKTNGETGVTGGIESIGNILEDRWFNVIPIFENRLNGIFGK